MTPTATRPRPQAGPGRLRPRARFALAACACAALVACGGGGSGTAGVGTGGTGSFAVGSINGLGSIFVNGVRFDTANAQVSNPNAPAETSLQLGMTVEVRGDINPNTQRGTAATVVVASELKGPIGAVNPTTNTLALFGRTVHVTPATIFVATAGLAQLAVGNVVEVYGLPQPDGSLRATRIEFEAVDVGAFVAPYGSNERFHVEGLLTNLGGITPMRTFEVAGVRFSETSATTVTGTLANNTEVTVTFAPTAANPPFNATSVRVESRAFAAGVGLAEIEGLVSGLETSTDGVRTFRLNGFPVRVNATGVIFEYDGPTQPNLVENVRVEVYGNIINGVLVATKVEFEDEANDLDAFEFAGVAVCPSSACVGTAGSFTLTLSGGRTVTIDYGVDTEFERPITPASLHNLRVEVDAEVISLGAGSGERFFATWIGPAD
jgi:hypothetical protein